MRRTGYLVNQELFWLTWLWDTVMAKGGCSGADSYRCCIEDFRALAGNTTLLPTFRPGIH